MPKGHWSAKCTQTLSDGQRCNQPAYFSAPDGTWPVCRAHASAESKFTAMTVLTAALLRGLEDQQRDAQLSVPPLPRAGTIDPAEIIAELRYIFREDLERAEQA